MKNRKNFYLPFILSVALIAAGEARATDLAGPGGAAAREPVTPAAAVGWASALKAFFDSSNPNAAALGAVPFQIAAADPGDPNLAPVTQVIQAAAESMNGREMNEATVEMKAVLYGPLKAHLNESQRKAYDELSAQNRAQIESKINAIAANFKTTLDVDATVDASRSPVSAQAHLTKPEPSREARPERAEPQAPQPEKIDLATMERMLKGYKIASGRTVYTGGNADADLLKRSLGKQFIASGVLEASFVEGMTQKTAYFWLNDGERKVYLFDSGHLFREDALKALRVLPVGKKIEVQFAVSYSPRLVNAGPFHWATLHAVPQAPMQLKPGRYTSPNGFTVEVSKDSTWGENVYHVRADGHSLFTAFYIDTRERQVFKIYRSKEYFSLASFVQESDGDHYTFEYGGAFTPRQTRITLTVNPATGELTSIGTRSAVVKWGFPNGWHSGPFKKVLDEFVADGLTRVP